MMTTPAWFAVCCICFVLGYYLSAWRGSKYTDQLRHYIEQLRTERDTAIAYGAEKDNCD